MLEIIINKNIEKIKGVKFCIKTRKYLLYNKKYKKDYIKR